VSICLAFFGSLGVFGLSFLTPNFFKSLDKFYHNDCLAFDRVQMDMQDYFVRNKSNVSNLVMTQFPRQVGSTKAVIIMKSEAPKEVGMPGKNTIFRRSLDSNVLKLRENNIQVPRGSLQVKGSQKLGEDDQIVMNNYIDRDNSARVFDDDKSEKPLTNNNISENKITKADYNSLPPHLARQYDTRGIGEYLSDEIIRSHKFANIFFENSVFCPFYVKFSKFIFYLSLKFGFCAILTTDTYLEARIKNVLRVSCNNNIRIHFTTPLCTNLLKSS
jgi:hypothetical protein